MFISVLPSLAGFLDWRVSVSSLQRVFDPRIVIMLCYLVLPSSTKSIPPIFGMPPYISKGKYRMLHLANRLNCNYT